MHEGTSQVRMRQYNSQGRVRKDISQVWGDCLNMKS